MDLFVSKLLPILIYPLGLAILLGLVALLLVGRRARAIGRLALLLALAILWVASTPAFSQWLLWQIEGQVPAVPLEDAPQASVAVVLGGAIGQPIPPRVAPDLLDSVDRVLDTARLYRAGKVSAVLVTAGNLPWQTSAKSEAELIADLLEELGVPRSAITVETESRNTFENAANARALFEEHGWTSGLLVTSAFHMPRALAVFRRAGLQVAPVTSDVRVHFPLVESPLDLLPDAFSLNQTTDAIKEIVGLLVYRLRGWA
ncbi:MAG: YdcF family protein [Bauldia sp.]|nr:YdcF family protein [Bauldia sp.]